MDAKAYVGYVIDFLENSQLYACRPTDVDCYMCQCGLHRVEFPLFENLFFFLHTRQASAQSNHSLYRQHLVFVDTAHSVEETWVVPVILKRPTGLSLFLRV